MDKIFQDLILQFAFQNENVCEKSWVIGRFLLFCPEITWEQAEPLYNSAKRAYSCKPDDTPSSKPP
jgi:hypothetical protein